MPFVFIGKWYFSSDELNHLNIVISSLFWPLILIYHGNLEQKIHIYFLLKWCNFLFTGDILKRKFDHLEVSGNRNGTPTTYFFNDNDSPTSHLYTPLQLLKLSQIESGIVLMQYWGWPPLCFLFLLRRRSGDPTEIFSVEKRFLLSMKDWCSDRPIRLHFILKLLSQRFLMGGVPSFICNLRDKDQIFWEGHKVWKRIQ